MPDDFDYSQPRVRPVNFSEQTPFVTYALVGLCVLATIPGLLGGLPGTPYGRLAHALAPPVEAVWDGQYSAFLTSAFVHGSFFHLLFNMVWLWQLGRLVEISLGSARYVLLFVAAAFVGAGAEIAVDGQTGVGASGVVYALFGMLWAGRGRDPAWRMIATNDNLRLFVGWGLFCVAATYFHLLNIANAAHGAGFLFGLSVGHLFYAPRRRPLWAVPLVLLLTLSVLSAVWVPWSAEWNFWKGNQQFERKNYAQAIAWYEKSQTRGADAGPTGRNISLAWESLALEREERGDHAGAEAAMKQAKQAAQTAGAPENSDGNIQQ